tara:strand:- start:47498 stop:47863 length:366 start_codon:yes stop_codon:yes gene_type:complete
MVTIIILALLLLITQVWLVPLALQLNKFDYLLSNREKNVDDGEALKRVKRSANNLLETLPAFLALAILSIVMDKEVYNLALYWLALRFLYFICYAFGVTIIRSVVWIASIACLVLMALALL